MEVLINIKTGLQYSMIPRFSITELVMATLDANRLAGYRKVVHKEITRKMQYKGLKMIAKNNRLFRIVWKSTIDNSVVFHSCTLKLWPTCVTWYLTGPYRMSLWITYTYIHVILSLFRLKLVRSGVRVKVCRHVIVHVQSTTGDKGYGVTKLHNN